MKASNHKRYERIRIIFLQDLLFSLLASLLAILLVRWLSDPIPGFTGMMIKWMTSSLVATCTGILLSGSYKDVRRFATVRSIGKTLLAVLIKEVLLSISLVFGLIKLPAAFDVLLVAVDLLLSGMLLSYIRVAARLLMKEKPDIKEIAGRRSALVEGTDAASLALAAELEKNGFEVVGLLSKDKNMAGRVISDYVVYTCTSDEELSLLQWRMGGIDSVFFPRALSNQAPKQEHSPEVSQTDGMTLFGHVMKRSFDIGLSSVLLLLFSPLIGLCAWMIKREDGGPVLYAQERIGRGGVPFQIYKFRSMRPDAEADGGPALYTGEDDPRLTNTGRFLRTHHLDELPQLWNVLRGDMSFIGYRPERKYYIDQIMACNSRYQYLYQIRPGVTSYATLYNGYTDTLEKMLTRLDLDLYYLRNHSVWFDVKVLGLTFLSIVIGKKF